MWLAVCDASDEPGLWSIAGLRRLGLEPLEVLLPEQLVTGTLVTYRIGTAGSRARLELRDGRVIRSDDLRGVLNRLPGLPAGPWAGLQPGDREYVAEELNAMLAGLLCSLSCPVLNPPDPTSLGGPTRTTAEWRVLAASVGLRARSMRVTSWLEPEAPQPSRRVAAAVVGARVFGVPAEIQAPCRALAASVRAPLLGLIFTVGEDERWLFECAFAQPDLRSAGEPALAALAEALGGRG